jgi:diketogulonate reductase-like aldo/keto reductase
MAAAAVAGSAAVPERVLKGVQGQQVGMPMVGIGTWEFNDSVVIEALPAAFRMGYRHVDTALVYENQVGVGGALRQVTSELNMKREEYFVTSKIPGGLNASATVASLDLCLSQLGLDYVDLMLIHFPASMDSKAAGGPTSRQEEWKALQAWAKTGKARAVGVSHYCRRQYQDVLDVTEVPVAVNQVQYHVGMGSAGGDATDDFNYFKSTETVYQSFSPLCGPCDPPDNTALVTGELVTEIGKAHNKTGPQVALRWLVQQGIPVIPKTKVPAHMKENIGLFDFELTKEEMAKLTAAEHPAVGGGPSPSDSGDCGIALEEDVMLV